MQDLHPPQASEDQPPLELPRPRYRKRIALLVAVGLVAISLCLYFFGTWETAHPGPSALNSRSTKSGAGSALVSRIVVSSARAGD